MEVISNHGFLNEFYTNFNNKKLNMTSTVQYPSPYMTITLDKEKTFTDNVIIWSETINEELLLNGTWYIKLTAISLTDIEHHANCNNEHRSPTFKIQCNLVKNNFQWFAKIINHQDTYQEVYPLELINIDNIHTNANDVLIKCTNASFHKINTINRRIEILLTPLNDKYKFTDFKCKASVQLCLYKG